MVDGIAKRLGLRIPPSKHLIAEGSGHYIHHDLPSVVLAAIRAMVVQTEKH